MKKIFRTVWIGTLSGLAFLTACNGPKGLTRQERKQLIKERNNIQEMLRAREGSCVYGTPDIIASYKAETYRLRSQLDTINAKLGQNVDLAKNARCAELSERIATLRAMLMEREGACVYGSPEVIEEYSRQTYRLRSELEQLEKELRELQE